LRENAFVFICNTNPATLPRPLTLASLCEPQAPSRTNGSAVPRESPTVLAAWIKYAGRSDSDDFLLEAQHGPSAGEPPDPRHPSATAFPTLLAALARENASSEQEPWYLIVCSLPVTSQREMAALECMCRKAEFDTLLRPSSILREQGGRYYQVWPSEVRLLCCQQAREWSPCQRIADATKACNTVAQILALLCETTTTSFGCHNSNVGRPLLFLPPPPSEVRLSLM
jgi:hypothetical protein